MAGDKGIRYIAASVLGIMLIVAGIRGNIGSMIAAFIDASQLQGGVSGQPPTGGTTGL